MITDIAGVTSAAEGNASAQKHTQKSSSDYFTRLSSNYTRSTGNATYKVFEMFLRTIEPSIVDRTSIINDNACGPLVATAAVVAHLGCEPVVKATDSNSAMIDVAKNMIETAGWRDIEAFEMDSHNLSFSDNTFTTVISNISITNYRDPRQCLQEMHRILKSNGLAIVSSWKRFAAAEILHKAQKLIKENSDLMKVPKAEFMEDKYLLNLMIQAKFSEVKQYSVGVVCTDDEVEGIKDFLLGDFTLSARHQYSRIEQSYWQSAVERAVQEEIQQFGGIKFEAWFIVAKK